MDITAGSKDRRWFGFGFVRVEFGLLEASAGSTGVGARDDARGDRDGNANGHYQARAPPSPLIAFLFVVRRVAMVLTVLTIVIIAATIALAFALALAIRVVARLHQC